MARIRGAMGMITVPDRVPKKQRRKEARAAAAAAAKKKKIASENETISQLDDSTVSNRVQKALGSATADPLSGDMAKGAKFGAAIIGEEGLGRIGEDSTVQAMESQAAELAKGFSSEEMQARKEQGIERIQGTTQSQSRAAQAQMARSGVKGQAAGAQLSNIAQAGIAARGDLERDLTVANREAQMQGLGIQSQMVTGNRKFDMAQAAKEKDIQMQTGLGFAQMGEARRGAAVASRAQVASAKASKQKCFVEGTPVELQDGSFKAIENINITDKVKDGGIVYSLHMGISSDLYMYMGVMVAGSHIVKEGEIWMRIEDSKLSKKQEGIYTVYNLGTENHTIIIEDIKFADFDETDYCSTINDEESLEVLNGNGSKILERGGGL